VLVIIYRLSDLLVCEQSNAAVNNVVWPSHDAGENKNKWIQLLRYKIGNKLERNRHRMLFESEKSIQGTIELVK
jgi:hypothetical protein